MAQPYGKSDADYQDFTARAQAVNNGTFTTPEQRGEATRGNGLGGGGGSSKYGPREYSVRDYFVPSNWSYANKVRLLYTPTLQEMAIYGADKQPVPTTSETGWLEYTEHRDAQTHRTFVCSGGAYRYSRAHKQPCHGCEVYWSEFEQKKAAKETRQMTTQSMSMTDRIVFNALVYDEYYLLDKIDSRTGKVVQRRNGDPIKIWTARHNNVDMGADLSSYVPVVDGYLDPNFYNGFGHVHQWEMNFTWKAIVNTLAKSVQTACISCGHRYALDANGHNTKEPAMYAQYIYCSNPECGVDIIENVQDTFGHYIEPVEKFIQQEFTSCPSCQTKAKPLIGYACNNCESPQSATIFQVDIDVNTIQGAREDQRTPQLVGWSDPYRTEDMAPEYQELIAARPNLNAIYIPWTLEQQRNLMQQRTFDVPGEAPAAPPTHREYGRPAAAPASTSVAMAPRPGRQAYATSTTGRPLAPAAAPPTGQQAYAQQAAVAVGRPASGRPTAGRTAPAPVQPVGRPAPATPLEEPTSLVPRHVAAPMQAAGVRRPVRGGGAAPF